MRVPVAQTIFRAALLAVLFLAARPLAADDATVLTISGKIEGGKAVGMTLSDIRALPPVTIATFDPWDRRERTYVGPRILDILKKVGYAPTAQRIRIHASNDYEIPILIKDLKRLGHILSYEMDGKPYAEYEQPGNKGELAVAIDFGKSDVDMEIYKHQLVWWVDAIVVE